MTKTIPRIAIYLALSAGLVSGVILLIVIKHLGWTWPYLCPSPKPLAQTLTH